MFLELFSRAGRLSQNHFYWLFYMLLGLVALTIALYHQHYLEEPPCVVCIQMRLLFLLMVLLSVFGLFIHGNKFLRIITNMTIVLITAVMIERSYLLLGTERGFLFSNCGFSLGLPAWFDIENWLPWLFRIESACGYTPEIFFGITMAEALMLSSVLLFLFSFCVFTADLILADSH